MTESPKPNMPVTAPRKRSSGIKRALWFTPLVLVVAVAPWFVPWRGTQAVPTSDPSSIIQRAESQRPSSPASAEQESGPTEESVKVLAKQLADSGAGYDTPVAAEVAGVSTTPGPYKKVGRIEIPSIGLDVTFGEGVYEKALLKGPGHWPGTPFPGQEGNSVLSGHRNTNTQPFKELDELRPKDKIVVTVGKGDPVTFRVNGTTIVPEAEYKNLVLRQPKDPAARQITLFACHPEGNPIFRIVVNASAEPTKNR